MFNDDRPDYLPSKIEDGGFENFDRSDYRTPRIILLQGQSPQIENFPETARKNHFWHSGLNVSITDEFTFTPCISKKKIILWRPRHMGGGILAFSSDAKKWDIGANKKFKLINKDTDEEYTINTGADVPSSGLTLWDRVNDKAPEAQTLYEYVCYLHDYPELSPSVLTLTRTGLANGKNLNTTLYTLRRAGRPTTCLSLLCFTEKKSNNDGEWTVPNFRHAGYVPKETYELCEKIAKEYKDFTIADYEQEQPTETKPIDEIAY